MVMDDGINDANKKNPDAIKALEPHENFLQAIVRRLIPNDEAAQKDLLQEVRLKAWRGWGSFVPEPHETLDKSIRKWLRTIVFNANIDRVRAKKARPEISVEGDDSNLYYGATASVFGDTADDNPEETTYKKQLSEAVTAALGKLPERQRQAIELFYREGYSQIEVGEIMGISDEAVESLLSRGRRQLKAEGSALTQLFGESTSHPEEKSSTAKSESDVALQKEKSLVTWGEFFKGKEKLKKWEQFEMYPKSRALMEQALSLGANLHEVEAILKKEGFEGASKAGIQGWFFENKLAGDRLAAYVLRLRAIGNPPVSENLLKDCSKIVKDFLVKSEKGGRTTLWRFLPETRAIAAAILEKGGAGRVPNTSRAVSRALGIVPRISDQVVDGIMRRAEKKEGKSFVEILIAGTPPFTERLTPDQIKKGREDAEWHLKIAQSRMRERSPLMEEDESRAFILALLENPDVPIPARLEAIVRKKYGAKVSVPDFKDAIDRTFRDPNDTRSPEEKRVAYAEMKRFGIPDDVYRRMKFEAVVIANAHEEDKKNTFWRSGKARSQEREIAGGRGEHGPLRTLVDVIRERRSHVPDHGEEVTMGVEWLHPQGGEDDATTVSIRIVGTNPEKVRQFYRYVLHEFEEIDANLDNELREALAQSGKQPVAGATLFGPRTEDLAFFSFTPEQLGNKTFGTDSSS